MREWDTTLATLSALLLLGLGAAALTLASLRDDEAADRALADGGTVCIEGVEAVTDVAYEAEIVRRVFASEKGTAIEVVSGCPRTSLFDGEPPESERELNRALEGAARVVRDIELPEGPRLVVYVVPPALYADYFGDAPFVRAVGLFYCSGHSCAAGGTSLYLPAGANGASVRAALQ